MSYAKLLLSLIFLSVWGTAVQAQIPVFDSPNEEENFPPIEIPVPEFEENNENQNNFEEIPFNSDNYFNSEPAPAYSLPPEVPYTLGPGDRIRMDVFDVEEYSGEYPVLVDGTLNLPIIGTVNVENLTLTEAANRISQKYKTYLVRPIITLGLVSPRPVQLAIAGEVHRPGSYNVNPNNDNFPSVTQALELAQGITLSADIRNVEIRRTYQGEDYTYVVNLWNLIQSGDSAQDIPLRDGDSVFIPTRPITDPAETRQLADASFAADASNPLQIAVVGEVMEAGTYTVNPEGSEEPPSVTKAIEQAGGITPFADVRNIILRRTPRSGTEEVISVNLWNLLQQGDLSQDSLLQSGDTILVPRAEAINSEEIGTLASSSFSPDTVRINVVGEVVTPGVQELPSNTPLNQAILAAGGFNNRAKKSRVELVRLNPNGTVSKEQIEVDLSQGISNENNPVLLNNDVVIVDRSTLSTVTDTVSSFLAPVGGVFSLFNFLRIFGF